MDLANLQISVTSKGVDSSLTQLDKFAKTASTVEKSVSSLNASFNTNGGLSNNIKNIGEAAKSASTELAFLVRQLNSIGVNKLSDLVKATTAVSKAQDSLNKSKGVAYEAWEKEEKAITNVKTANQKLATELQKTKTELQKTNKETSNAEIASIKSAKATSALAEAHKNSTKSLSGHTAGWIHHMAVVSGGIVLYQALRFAMLSLPTMILGAAIKSVSDYQDAVIGSAAMYATLAKNQTDIAGNYKEATRYAKAMIPILMEIDNYTSLNLQDLIQMNLQFAAHGVAIDGNNKKQVQGFTNIANALVVLTKGQATSRQINQEVRAIMDGTTKSSDQLSLKLDILLKGRLKEMSKEWRKIGAETGNAGLIVEKYGELLEPFSEAAKVMEGTWSNVTSSMKTTFDILAIDAFSPIFEEWTKKLKEFNDEARSSKTVAETVNGSLELLSTGVGTIGGVIGSIFGTLWSLMVDFGNQVVKSLGIDMMDLFSEFQNGWQASSAIFASAGAAILVVIESIRSGIKQIGITAGGAFSQVANLLTLGGLGDSKGLSNSKIQYNNEVAFGNANIAKIQKDLEKELYNIRNSGVKTKEKSNPKLGFDLMNTGGDDKTGANKAAKAEKNLREERERLASQVEDLIGKENFVTKAIREMEKGEDLLSKARTKGAIDQSKYSEGLAVLMKRESEAIGKPFTDIINKYKFVKDSSEQYAKSIDTIEKNQKTLTEEYNKGSISSDLYKAKLKEAELAYNSTIEEQIRDIDKIGAKYTELKNDTGGYVKALETLQNKLENAKDQRVKDDVARVNDLLIESYNKEVLAKYGVVLATTNSVAGNKKLIASTNDAIKAHDNYVKSISGVLNEVGPAAGLSSGFITNMTDALDEFNKGAILGGKNLKGIASAVQAIGSQFGGRVGDALVGLGVGFKAVLSGPVLNADGTTNQAATDMSQIGGYAAIGQNIGALIGGSTGQKISSTVSGAVSGMSIGAKFGAAAGPVGMAIGGILGGALGLFGGGDDSAKKAAKVQSIQEQEKEVSNLAEGGSSAARYMMRMANYDISAVGAIDSRTLSSILPENVIQSTHYKNDYRVFDVGNGSDTIEFLTALDGIEKAFRSISESSIVTELDDITYKYEMIGAKIGDNADLWAAKLSEQMLLLTGFSVDSTSSVLDEIITSTDPSKVGDAFAEKMTEGLATSLRQMEISKFATTLAEQTLTPLYEEATRMMLSGGDSSTALAAVNDGLISVGQQVTDFANNLDGLGISGYKAATTVVNTVKLIEYSTSTFATALQSALTTFEDASSTFGVSGVSGEFAKSVSASINGSVRQILVDAFVTSKVTPVMTPLYEALNSVAQSGGDTTSAINAIDLAIASLQPEVTDFTNTLINQGLVVKALDTTVQDATGTVTDATGTVTDATTAVRTAADILSEGMGIQRQIWELEGNVTAIRADELVGLDASNIALKNRYYGLVDERTETEKLNALKASGLSLDMEYWNLIGDTASIQAATLAALDPSLWSKQQRNWDTEAAIAAAKAASDASSALDSTISSLSSFETARRELWTGKANVDILSQMGLQGSAVQSLISQALAGNINDSTRVNAMSALPGAVSSYADSMQSTMTSPQDYFFELAKVSGQMGEVTTVTMSDVKQSIDDLKSTILSVGNTDQDQQKQQQELLKKLADLIQKWDIIGMPEVQA